MTEFLMDFNTFIFYIFIIFYAYQVLFTAVSICKKLPNLKATQNHRFAFLVAARNEEAVIGNLIDSIRKQNYPLHLIDIFVVADNCTDHTAQVARAKGAIVYQRNNTLQVGKGYALDFLFSMLKQNYSEKAYDAFFIFDADNILDAQYTAEMNKLYCNGYKVATCYRNSQNYSTNWISAGYALWFIRESRFLNYARMQLGTSCAVSGTGFMVANSVIKENNGWKFTLLTEDIEFSVSTVLSGGKIGYSHDAIIYDEQPECFSQSWNQRLRWSKGFYQVLVKYGTNLLKRIFTKQDFASYDMLMSIAPAFALLVINMLLNAGVLIVTFGDYWRYPVLAYTASYGLFWSLISFYSSVIFMGVMTLIFERKRIVCPIVKRIVYLLLFPIFIFTYVPISIVALFKKVKWVPIKHGEAQHAPDLIG